MSEQKLTNRSSNNPRRENSMYVLGLGVAASMLWIVGIPTFMIFFFGLFGYLLLKMFSAGPRSETRDIFEFYLSANEMLRDDERRWFGFEIRDAIVAGETIVKRMKAPPPLVYFALGALYNKAGDHKAAVNNLSQVVENDRTNELSYVFATPELRKYVRVLRKIERDPADAPMTSSAVRALERARKIRGKAMLEESRVKFASGPEVVECRQELTGLESVVDSVSVAGSNGVMPQNVVKITAKNDKEAATQSQKARSVKRRSGGESGDYEDRQSISELLHDIYDNNSVG